MKKLMMILAVVTSICAFGAEPDYYAQISAWAPGQIPTSPNSDIMGLRCSLVYGDCQRLNGLDFGMAGRVRERVNGAQICAIMNIVSSAAGFQFSFANYAENEFHGFQLGAWNHSSYGAGLQLGVVNTASRFAGLQAGLFNWADDLDGLQIGLVNVVADQQFYVLPILNVGF